MGEKVEDLVNLCERSRITRAERERVGSVRSNSFNTVKHQLLQVRYFLALAKETDRKKRLLALGKQAVQRRGWNPRGRRRRVRLELVRTRR